MMENEKRLIDANALEALFRRYAKIEDNDTQYDIGRVHGLIEAADHIKRAPTVDAVEVVHGRWIEGFFKNTVECSACFEKAVHHCYTEKTNYCPKCGAKMDGDNQ